MKEKKLSPHTRYKKTTLNGKPIDSHKKAMLLALNISKIPRGFVVHHIDGDKMNNDINNLSILTITAHNRIHSHKAWNKGVTAKDNIQWAKTIKKIHKKRNKTFINRFKEAHKLRTGGLTVIQISKKLNISRNAVYNRIKKYEQFISRRKN